MVEYHLITPNQQALYFNVRYTQDLEDLPYNATLYFKLLANKLIAMINSFMPKYSSNCFRQIRDYTIVTELKTNLLIFY